jgi:hypothetical protein
MKPLEITVTIVELDGERRYRLVVTAAGEVTVWRDLADRTLVKPTAVARWVNGKLTGTTGGFGERWWAQVEEYIRLSAP